MKTAVIDELLAAARDAPVLDVRVGAFWSAVVVGTLEDRRCGLASNPERGGRPHAGSASVRAAGELHERSALELAELARSESVIEASVGLAALNALLLPRELPEGIESDLNAEEVIARHGAGKRVALVGGFPFIARLRERVGSLRVLELSPEEDELSAEAASREIPRADVVAITASALVNHTFDGLLAACRSDALVVVLGPSTPLSPILLDRGVDVLAGSVVEDVDAVLRAVSQGASFRQIKHRGVRLVAISRRDLRTTG